MLARACRICRLTFQDLARISWLSRDTKCWGLPELECCGAVTNFWIKCRHFYPAEKWLRMYFWTGACFLIRHTVLRQARRTLRALLDSELLSAIWKKLEWRMFEIMTKYCCIMRLSIFPKFRKFIFWVHSRPSSESESLPLRF